MFAVIRTGGKQYRVTPNDVLEIGKIAGDVGTIVQFGEVLAVGGDTPLVGVPLVGGALVAAELLQHKRGPKVIAFKKRRRQNSRRKRGYRDEISVIRVTEILTDGKQPTVGPRPRKEKVAKDASAEAAPAKKTAPKAEKVAKAPKPEASTPYSEAKLATKARRSEAKGKRESAGGKEPKKAPRAKK
jgi:large subunit ribosomal protein L21